MWLRDLCCDNLASGVKAALLGGGGRWGMAAQVDWELVEEKNVQSTADRGTGQLSSNYPTR